MFLLFLVSTSALSKLHDFVWELDRGVARFIDRASGIGIGFINQARIYILMFLHKVYITYAFQISNLSDFILVIYLKLNFIVVSLFQISM